MYKIKKPISSLEPCHLVVSKPQNLQKLHQMENVTRDI
jgi:hypothetical protein